MYEQDLPLLRCPISQQLLRFGEILERAPDGEIINGSLVAGTSCYPIRNGIPRFIEDISYNASWDFKWTHLDAGRGHNYRIIDKDDTAYAIHDIYDRNSHCGMAYRHMEGGRVLDLGCGIGQYAVKSLLEHPLAKVVAVDLTRGVDLFRQIVDARYPELKRRLLIVQASVFALPFPPGSFDFVFSLGVLMHTGDTLRALDIACKQVRDGGELNVWIYCSESLAYDAVEPGRRHALNIANVKAFLRQHRYPMFWIHLFRKVPHRLALAIVRFFSSDAVYNLSKRKYFRWLALLFPSVDHPDFDYRLINNYDGYINNWCDTWSEYEIFPTLRANDIVIYGMSDWRLGIWGHKTLGYYPPLVPVDRPSC